MQWTSSTGSFSISWLTLVTLIIALSLLFMFVRSKIRLRRALNAPEQDRPLTALQIQRIRYPNVVATLHLQGTILPTAGNGPPVPGALHADVFIRKLRILQQSPALKALIVHGTTPGGSSSASENIRAALAEFAEHKLVFFYVSDHCMSGGMMAMSAFTKDKHPDRVFASPGALLGSIGVVGPTLMSYNNIRRMSGILGSGIQADSITGEVLSSGAGKAFGHPFANDEDKEWAKRRYQQMLDDTRDAFVRLVSGARGVQPDTFSKQGDGVGATVMTAVEAEQRGLIDGLLSRAELDQKVMETLKKLKLVEEDDVTMFVNVSRKQSSPFRQVMNSRLLSGFQPMVQTDEQLLRTALLREPVLALHTPELFGV